MKSLSRFVSEFRSVRFLTVGKLPLFPEVEPIRCCFKFFPTTQAKEPPSVKLESSRHE